MTSFFSHDLLYKEQKLSLVWLKQMLYICPQDPDVIHKFLGLKKHTAVNSACWKS